MVAVLVGDLEIGLHRALAVGEEYHGAPWFAGSTVRNASVIIAWNWFSWAAAGEIICGVILVA